MNVDAEINIYLSKLSEPEKILILDLIKKINDTTSNVSIAEKILIYNNELEEAVQKIKSGDFIDHSNVLNEADEW